MQPSHSIPPSIIENVDGGIAWLQNVIHNGVCHILKA